MHFNHTLKVIFLFYIAGIFVSCKKYLEAKSDESLSTIETVDDLQELSDNKFLNSALELINSNADEYYLTKTDWQPEKELTKRAYVWDKDVNDYDDWSRQYTSILYSNTILDNLGKVTTTGQQTKINAIHGSALFTRAHCFYQLAQIFAPQYDSSTAAKDLSIPLRLNANFNEASVRASVQQTYDRIIEDLLKAATLLPSTPLYKTRPSKAACYALLSRTFLQAGNYSKAKEYADACLQIHNKLLDFNSSPVEPTSNSPIPIFNNEVIYFTFVGTGINSKSKAKIDSTLYNLYEANDLRKIAFFRLNSDGTYRFKGSYNGGSSNLFNGLATDEVYLIRAESNARLGNVEAALNDLNTLLSNRYIHGTFTPITATNADDALSKIIVERRKEMIYRGTRWPDLRRLNKEARFATTLKRILAGENYLLPPRDLRYTLLIPLEVMQFSNLQQNPR